MSLKKSYRGFSKLNSGWKCDCCNSYQTSPRRMKVRARRLARRVGKQRMQSEVH